MSISIEKFWPAVPPQQFTVDGNTFGVVTVADARGFKVKQVVAIGATGQPQIQVQIKRFISATSFYVGPLGIARSLTTRTNLSAYTVAAGAFIYAEEQPKVILTPGDITQAVYEQEPANAIRSYNVDQFGQGIDSVLGSDGINRIAVDAEVTVNTIQLINLPYDTGEVTYPLTTQEVYTTYVGGYSGTPVQQITVNYTDATKVNLLNWQRANWNGSMWVVE